MDLLLDTNIIVIYSRDNAIANRIEAVHQIFSDNNRLGVSTITLGEVNAIIKKLQIGSTRADRINQILEGLNKFDISFEEVIERYGEIDAYSQGKLQSRQGNFSSRNMGKNDIWIAATASVFNLTLVTTDKDFNHLDGVYLNLNYIALSDFT